jgi:hypothetical protein
MMRMVAVLKKIFLFLRQKKNTATHISVFWEAEEHKIKIKNANNRL